MFVFAVNMSVCVVGGLFLLHKVVTPSPSAHTTPTTLQPPLTTTTTQPKPRHDRGGERVTGAIFVGSFLMATDVVIANWWIVHQGRH